MKFENRSGLKDWLDQQPHEFSVVIAARAAMRVLPLLYNSYPAVLPVCRALAVGWVAESWSDVKLRPYAFAANSAAVNAASATFAVADDAANPAAEAAANAAYAAANAAVNAAVNSAADASANYAAANAANGAAYAAAKAADANAADAKAADASLWRAISYDAEHLLGANGRRKDTPRQLADRRLWSTRNPAWAKESWALLKKALLEAGEDWEVWTDWYDARLRGGSVNKELEIARVTEITDDEWGAGPKVVNAKIKDIIARFEKPITAKPQWDFFVSYSTADESYARWVGDIIQSAGFTYFAQFKEMRPGNNFVREMQRGLAASSHMIALLSARYEKSNHCQAEWAAAYNADAGGTNRKLIPLLIEAHDLNPLARQIVYKSLVGLSPEDATKAVLDAIGYSGASVDTPTNWPGSHAIERMEAAAGGVFSVAPGQGGRLERQPIPLPKSDEGPFSPEQQFKQIADEIADFLGHLRKAVPSGNFAYSSRLQGRVEKLAEVTSVGFISCDQIAVNKALVWALRVIALDQSEGALPHNDEIHHYASDLYGYYNRLGTIFPKLSAFRNADARSRFEPPSDKVESSILFVHKSFGDVAVSGDALSSGLASSFRSSGQDIEDAKADKESVKAENARNAYVESHTEAAARALAVWGWVANARERLVKSGKSAEEITQTIERYGKLYKYVSPQMKDYVGYLLKWFY